MPEWEIHNKWARRLGIPEKISNFVNSLVDFPEENQEFMEFLDTEDKKLCMGKRKHIVILPYRATVGKHDSGRRRKTAMYLQLRFLRQKGSEYVKAWYLHHILDYIKSAPVLGIEEILKRVENKTESCKELEIVKNFVMSNSDEILEECR
ncbi:MAG: hypothetical protein B9J98_00080 [Candidatus Terraquivivens tikiterensis]|uniref:Uncharacterized protein n=1 Tax=Candidatus Terraquivivens tikiterensis TaxID=1980982 RepID=A0A2R7Y9W4_9ARCH|nr:MAG: hypothetical protein B9J98_00080 [Candidatus Terraquivivens tikiterensis]